MKFETAHIWLENDWTGIDWAWYENAFQDPYIAGSELSGCYDETELKVAIL
jgi:hypothetical protein